MLNRGLSDAERTRDFDGAEKYRKALEDLDSRAADLAEGGEAVRLNPIGERLSKITKREGMTAVEQERAIAEKIFESVDAKAAESKTRENPKKGVNREKQLFADELTVTPEERKIMESPHEILLVYEASGRLKSVILGGAREVGIPANTPSDAIISHNHPSGRGPSDSDIKAVLTQPGRTLRIITRNENGETEVFSIKAKRSIPDEDIAVITGEYRAAAVEGGDTAAARRVAVDLLLEIYEDILLVSHSIQ